MDGRRDVFAGGLTFSWKLAGFLVSPSTRSIFFGTFSRRRGPFLLLVAGSSVLRLGLLDLLRDCPFTFTLSLPYLLTITGSIAFPSEEVWKSVIALEIVEPIVVGRSDPAEHHQNPGRRRT
jgi:hypothetical protein